MRAPLLVLTHGVALGAGIARGIYLLPILTAPAAPTAAEVRGISQFITAAASR